MTGNPPLQLRIDAARRARWQAKADAAGMKLVDWARDRLDKADEASVLVKLDEEPPLVKAMRSGGGKRYTGPDPKTGKK